MPQTIWEGTISFGLVTIPVRLVAAEDRGSEIAFHNIDSKTMSRVRQKRVSEATGEEVPWEDVAKGYEYESGRYVVLEPAEIEAANPKATRTIDIVAVVCGDCIDPPYFTRPYYLVPQKAGRKAYALLREALRAKNQVAVAHVVLRTRQYLAALFPEGDALVLDLLRYADELRGTEDLDLPSADLEELGVTEKELQLADQLVSALEAEWEPGQYTDTYRNDLLDLIKKKVEAGGTMLASAEEAGEAPAGEVVDIMDLLRRSVESAARDKEAGGRKRGTA
ncbi:MAG TPA: Ku protein [Coriobacteriia bacterium]|nr:MAG: DNA repair protein [Actinobacteria bacterium 66_15]HAL31024.1 Ku protein [Coriobacteriia bacterium]